MIREMHFLKFRWTSGFETKDRPAERKANSNTSLLHATSALINFYRQVIMGVLSLGSLSVLLSEPMLSGFTTGAAVHVIASQLKGLFDIQVQRRKGIFKVILVCGLKSPIDRTQAKRHPMGLRPGIYFLISVLHVAPRSPQLAARMSLEDNLVISYLFVDVLRRGHTDIGV